MKSALILALFSVVAGLTACDSRETKNDSRTRICSAVAPGIPAPSAVWRMKNGADLVVCALNSSQQVNESTFRGWVNLYSAQDGALRPFLADVTSDQPDNVQTFQIHRESDSVAVITRALLPMSHGLGVDETPLTEIRIRCEGTPCAASPESCVGQPKPQKSDVAQIRTVENIVKRKSKAPQDYDVVIGQVIQAAAAGDARALRLILDTPPEKLQATGAAAAQLESGRRLLTHLKELNCLAKSRK